MIAVFGDLNLDTSVTIPAFPLPGGDTIFTFHQITDGLGGAAANVAVGLQTLGNQVAFGSVIGQDAIGALVLRALIERGIETRYIRRDWEVTSRSVVLVDAEGNRRCINDPKWVHEYTYPAEAVTTILSSADLVYCSTQNWCRPVALQAATEGKRVVVDVHAIIEVDDYHRDFFYAADIIILSTERLSIFSHDFMRHLWSEFDVQVVVATHGEHGATLGIRESGEIVYQPALKVPHVVDRTGAGDAFCAGFLTAIANKQPYTKALEWGQKTAAHKIQRKGSTNGYPTLNMLLA